MSELWAGIPPAPRGTGDLKRNRSSDWWLQMMNKKMRKATESPVQRGQLDGKNRVYCGSAGWGQITWGVLSAR